MSVDAIVSTSLFAASFTLSNKIQVESIHISDRVDRSAFFGRSALELSTLDMSDLMKTSPLFVKSIIEIEYDAEKEKQYLDSRRVFVTAGWLNALEIGAGENIIIWGKGDELNPTDVINAENYEKFIILPKDRRKIARPMATAKFGLMSTYLTLVAMPSIQRNRFPDARSSNWCRGACQKSNSENLVQSFAGKGLQVKFDSLKLPEREMRPELSQRYENLGDEWEYAARLERSFTSVDISLMAHQGIERFPIYKRKMTGSQSFTFTEISAQRMAYGGDISFTLGDIVLRGEGIIKENKTFMIASDSPLFQNDRDGLVYANEWEYLVGLDYNIFWNIFVSAQYFERADNSAFIGLIRNQGNKLVSTLVRRHFFSDDLLLEYRTLTDIQDKSSVHYPTTKYRFTDYLSCSIQGQIFIGDDNTTFGDYTPNSGALSSLELEF